MDFVVKLLPLKDFLEPGNLKYNSIWVVINQFTKMACFLHYKEETRADILARCFLKYIFSTHKLLQSIVLDKGSIFAAKFTKAALDIKRKLLQF